MEKGYFHFNLAGQDFEPLTSEEVSELARAVPLPNQIPQKQDLTKLPKEILRSSTIESLIEQNDDLMSRLSVSLRKAARFESLVQEAAEREFELQSTVESLRDQLLVFRQKETLFDDRTGDLQDRIETLQDQLAFQTYALEQKDTLFDDVQSENALLLTRLHRLQRYRRAMRALLPTYKTQQRENLRTLSAENEKFQILYEREQEMKRALQMRMDDILAHLQTSRLGFEKRIQELETRATALSEENIDLLDKVQDHRKLEETIIDHENKILAQERAFLEKQSEFEGEIVGLQRELGQTRQDCKNKILEIENQAAEITDKKRELENLKTELSRSSEQVEALQSLWSDSQNKLERYEAQIHSLQKLNQHLSIELQALRQNKFKGEDQRVLEQISATVSVRAAAPESEEVFERIDGLINQIQSGFSHER